MGLASDSLHRSWAALDASVARSSSETRASMSSSSTPLKARSKTHSAALSFTAAGHQLQDNCGSGSGSRAID